MKIFTAKMTLPNQPEISVFGGWEYSQLSGAGNWRASKLIVTSGESLISARWTSNWIAMVGKGRFTLKDTTHSANGVRADSSESIV